MIDRLRKWLRRFLKEETPKVAPHLEHRAQQQQKLREIQAYARRKK